LFLKERAYFTNRRRLVQQGSSPSNFARPTFMTRKQDILSSVCVLPINVSGCSFQRHVQEMDHAIFKFVDHKTCQIYLVCPSTAYLQNNVHKTTHLWGHCQAFYEQYHFEFCHDKKKWPNEEPNKMPSICLLSTLLINLVLINLTSLIPKKTIWTTVRACCQGLQTPIPLRVKPSCFPSTSTWESTICGWWWWCIELCLTNPFHFFMFLHIAI